MGSWAGCMGKPVKGKVWGAADMRPCDRPGKDRARWPRRSSSNMAEPAEEEEGSRESISACQCHLWRLPATGGMRCTGEVWGLAPVGV